MLAPLQQTPLGGSVRRTSNLDPDFPFDLSRATLHHGSLCQEALIILPRKPMVVGRDRLVWLAEAQGVNAVERSLIEVTAQTRARVVILRAANDRGESVWEFDAALPDSELPEAGYIVSRALLPLHRRLAAAGAALMVHTEWGYREAIAFRHGTERLLRERVASGDESRHLDEWVLKNMLLHVQLSVDHVLTNLLPGHLSLIERRLGRIGQLLERTPAWALD